MPEYATSAFSNSLAIEHVSAVRGPLELGNDGIDLQRYLTATLMITRLHLCLWILALLT